MSASALSSVLSTAAQQSLLSYMGAWSTLSLSQARVDPFSVRHLPSSMQAAVASGMLEREGLEPASASSYVRQAVLHERALLERLGVEPSAIDTFVESRLPYGAYFDASLHSWQDNEQMGKQVVRQLEQLQTAVSLCQERLQAWRSSRETFKVIRDQFGLDHFLGKPLNELKGILERNVARARLSIRDYGVSEEGLLVFLKVPSSRTSGVYLRDELLDYAALETIAPPAAG